MQQKSSNNKQAPLHGISANRQTYVDIASYLFNTDTASIYKKFSKDVSFRGKVEEVSRLPTCTGNSNLNDRIVYVKSIIVLLPSSMPMVHDLFQPPAPSKRAEVQFTFLCYVDDIQTVDKLKCHLQTITAIIEKFLLNSSADTARATWMAVHLLAEHWPIEYAWPSLKRVVTDSRFRVARKLAIQGIVDLWPNLLTSNPMYAKEARALLRNAATEDRSIEVRREALSSLRRMQRLTRSGT